jgi:uncharacterized protein (DUF2141 family)
MKSSISSLRTVPVTLRSNLILALLSLLASSVASAAAAILNHLTANMNAARERDLLLVTIKAETIVLAQPGGFLHSGI